MAKVSRAWRPLSRQAAFAAVTFAVALLGAANLSAQAPKVTEYQVKAAYLANFGRFVEWPTSAAVAKSESFNICVLGQDPFGADLDAAVATTAIRAFRPVGHPNVGGGHHVGSTHASRHQRHMRHLWHLMHGHG